MCVWIHGFWSRQQTAVFNVRVTDTDAKSYSNCSDKILERHARDKKTDYNEACPKKRRDFTPLIYSINGMTSKGTRTVDKKMTYLVAKKWHRPHPKMVCYVKRQMSLAVVRSNTMLLQGDRSTSLRCKGAEDGVVTQAGEQRVAR